MFGIFRCIELNKDKITFEINFKQEYAYSKFV
jgi:hypothetical protein